MRKFRSESISAFRKALKHSNGGTSVQRILGWLPQYRQKYSRRLNGSERRGIAYNLLRWPMLSFMIGWLTSMMVVYVTLRIVVMVNESTFLWTGERLRKRSKLLEARNYSEWLDLAQDLDKYLKLDKWQANSESSTYDWRTVDRSVKELKRIPKGPFYSPRSQKDVDRLLTILEGCIRYNFAGTHSPTLYSQCYSGTKRVVVELNSLIVQRLEELKLSDEQLISTETKARLFSHFDKQLGSAALCLSGGGAFAYRHLGVVRALLDEGLLPNIVSGASGGSIVAAFVCTRTNEEIGELLTPELNKHLRACWEPFPAWFCRWLRTGARFDPIDWAERLLFVTMGDMTFLEAYERTGKILNISAIPANLNSPPFLLNYLTCPDCLIWSAVLASSAVPGVLDPVVLMRKTKNQKFVPYSFGTKWQDGTLRIDVPLKALNTYFNVNFSIVSQVNPHVRLFAYSPRGNVGWPVSHRYSISPWRGGFLSAAMETGIQLEVRKCLKMARSLDLFPRVMGQELTTIILQRFEGNATIWPKLDFNDLWYILSDPDEKQLASMMADGRTATYPTINMIRHFTALAQAVKELGELSSENVKTPLS